MIARIPLGAPAPAYRAEPGHIARLSLAWWDATEPEGQREPILVESRAGVARTLVVVWPTDSRGCVDLQRAQRGDVEVLPWDLIGTARSRLAELARLWPLDRHDLLVWPGHICPCSESLLPSKVGVGLKGRIEAAIARIDS